MVQVVLIIVCLICVPILLLPKPFILKSRHEKKLKGHVRSISTTNIQDSDVSLLKAGFLLNSRQTFSYSPST